MLMHDDNRKELTRLLVVVELRLGQLPKTTYETRHLLHQAVEQLELELEQQEGARFGEQSGNHTVSLAGIRAGSTMSVNSALQNWCVGVRKRLGDAA